MCFWSQYIDTFPQSLYCPLRCHDSIQCPHKCNGLSFYWLIALNVRTKTFYSRCRRWENESGGDGWWGGTCCSVGPLVIDKVHSQWQHCVSEWEKEDRGRVHREISDAATETMWSPGQHNKALSTDDVAWIHFRWKGGAMYSSICIYSPHHISTAMNEALAQTAPTSIRQSELKPFTTHLLYNTEKNPFWGGSHRAEPSGRSVFRLWEHGTLQRQRKMACFSQKSGE